MVYPSVRVAAKAAHTASVIFLHGLGDTGHGWSFLAQEAARLGPLLDHVQFVFPNAPTQPVSVNMGMAMPSWYDIVALGRIEGKQDEAGVLKSVDRLRSVIAEEVAAGVPTDRIVIGGFSQGCAVALAASCVLADTPLAGVIGLSGYMPVTAKIAELETPCNKHTPYFLGHGTADSVVRFEYGTRTRDFLKNELKRDGVSWNEYPGLDHGADPEELAQVLAFIASRLPKN